MHAYFLRPAIEPERARIFETYCETVGPYIAEAWGWDEDYQLANFWKHHPFADFQTIRVGDNLAGGLHIEQDVADVFIRMVFLAPEFQGLGIGSRLITDLHSVAQESGKSLSLKVVRTNPARRLYERLGFHISNQDDSSLDMRWPQPDLAKAVEHRQSNQSFKGTAVMAVLDTFSRAAAP